MPLMRIALASLANRRFSAGLTLFAIALSVALLLGVERVRHETRASFTQTVSGTDLIVGARAGSVNLLLYSVFGIGHASSNIAWSSYQQIAAHPQVKWAIPLSLGDSHRGYRVRGTSAGYFDHYRYGQQQPLQLSQGRFFAEDPHEVVLGAEVARALGYSLNAELVLGHGTGPVSLVQHHEHPFRVVGILQRTGTPVDRTLHIALSGMQALHQHWPHGAPPRGAQPSHPHGHAQPPQPITAVLLGLQRKVATFAVQREINQSRAEPLLAILPGVALQELWSLMGTAEKALRGIALCVVLIGLIGMLTALVGSLNERRREMAILRAMGARPWHIAGLLVLEAAALALAGCLLGLALLYLGLALLQQPLQSHYGLYLPLAWPSAYEWSLLAGILGAALLMGAVPAWRAYRQSLADCLSIRL
jgi:putative ABC transport system permease protein